MGQCSYSPSRTDATAIRQVFIDTNAKKEEHEDIGIEIQRRLNFYLEIPSWRRLSAKEGGEHFPLKKEKLKENGFEAFLKKIY